MFICIWKCYIIIDALITLYLVLVIDQNKIDVIRVDWTGLTNTGWSQFLFIYLLLEVECDIRMWERNNVKASRLCLSSCPAAGQFSKSRIIVELEHSRVCTCTLARTYTHTWHIHAKCTYCSDKSDKSKIVSYFKKKKVITTQREPRSWVALLLSISCF